MKKYTLSVLLVCFCLLINAQTSTGKHHIKFLEINSGNPDFGVSFLEKNQVVFATTTSDKVINTKKHNPHLDLYRGTVGNDGAIVKKERINNIAGKRISKNGATFTKDGKTVYFSASKYSKRKSKNRKVKYEMYKASIDAAGKWHDIKELPFSNKKVTSTFPTINKDNTKLYFVSDRAPTFGGTDIFVVDINKDGTYSEPVNLGPKVNTKGNETTPFITENNFLYFSSDGREDSLGNLDIYTSEIFNNTVSEPLHLASPINSINDDFAYIINNDNKGYFSSNRLQGRGNDDMYSFYIEPDQPKECLQQIVGTVRDKESESLITDATISIIDENGKEVNSFKTDERGNYRFKLDCRNTYTVVASKQQYGKEEHIVNTANYFNAPPLEINQSLAKLAEEIKRISEEKVVIKVNPIYFGFDKSNINSESANELDRIVKIMKENPALIIEAASHTDSRGPKSYNQKLSQRRAKSTVNYIVSKGIDRNRITAKGYGESQLLNKCKDGVRCTKENHKLNRRTEFIIVNKQVLNLPKQKDSNTETAAIKEETKVEKIKNLESTQPIVEEEIIETESVDELEPIEAIDQPIENTENLDNLTTSFKEITKDIEKKKNESIDSEDKETTKIVSNKTENIAITATNLESNKDINVTEENEAVKDESNKVFLINKNSKKLAQPIQEKANEKSLNKSDIEGKEAIITSIKKVKENKGERKVLVPDKNLKTYLSPTSIGSDNLSNSNSNAEKKVNQNIEINPTLESDFSVLEKSEENINEKNIISENKELQAATFNKDFSKSKNNISSVSDNLFADTDDFESYDDKAITSKRFKSKVTDDSKEVKSTSIAKTTAKIKRQFLESTQGMTKEEVLVVNTIDVSPMAIKRNGKYTNTNSASKVDVMRINFQVDNNKYISPGYKEVYILIQNPKGIILNRKGSFEVNNGEKLMYTEKTNAYYNNNHLNLSMMTDRFIQKIIKGEYTVTIYIEGYPVGLEVINLS